MSTVVTKGIGNSEPPKVFISYSWTSEEHREWVVELAERLQGDGVHVVADFWDLKAGHDKYEFMEQMVADSSIHKVLLILDERYAERADSREGGVGSELQIISADVYKKAKQERFVPIVATRSESGEPYLPIYLKGRVYIDLSSRQNFAAAYEQLLRSVFDRPARQRPTLGTPPAFLDEASRIPVTLKFKLDRVIDAIEHGSKQASGHLRQFLADCVSALGECRIRSQPKEPLDEVVWDLIRELTPIRDQLLRVFETTCNFDHKMHLYREFQKFLENCIPLMFRPADLNQWSEAWFDHYRFFLRELILYMAALLIKHERYEQLNMLVSSDYMCHADENFRCERLGIYCAETLSLDHLRKSRLQLNRVSITADLLKERSPACGVDFDRLIEADIILTLKFYLDEELLSGLRWWPATAVFAERAFRPLPLFARFRAGRESEAIGLLFGTAKPEDFLDKLNYAYEHRDLKRMTIGYFPIRFQELTGVADLHARRTQERLRGHS